jgi:hypothetical protein
MSTHTPRPDAESANRTLAVVVAEHHKQGSALLGNGVIHFADDIDLRPSALVDGTTVEGARPGIDGTTPADSRPSGV